MDTSLSAGSKHDLDDALEKSAQRHSHLCPRQVLGVRVSMAAAAILGLEIPRSDKRLLVIAETDGCFASAIEAATGCSVGHRTLRIEDYGKIAATFVDTESEQAVRLAPRAGVRQAALAYLPDEASHYKRQLHAYQVMPDGELLSAQNVRLAVAVEAIISRPRVRATCDRCGEEVINEREIIRDGTTLCRACATMPYYVVPTG
jgi:formylmethanofuran dehydrogenase subunit E